MPKPIKKKIVKKHAAEIEVSGVISQVKDTVKKKKDVFTTVVAACVILIVAVIGFSIYTTSARTKAENLEYEAYKTYYGLYQKQAVAKDEQYNKAAEMFKKAYDNRKSPVSLFYIANCYFELGKYDDALNALKELNQKFPDDERFVPLSYHKMAMISLKKNNSDEALKYLDVLYKYKTGAYKDLSLLETAKIFEASGRTEDAKIKYQELSRDFPKSPFAEEALTRLGEKKG